MGEHDPNEHKYLNTIRAQCIPSLIQQCTSFAYPNLSQADSEDYLLKGMPDLPEGSLGIQGQVREKEKNPLDNLWIGLSVCAHFEMIRLEF